MESTYNKYKRQNNELKMLLSIEIKNFILDAKDYKERIDYLHKCIKLYRHNKLQEYVLSKEESKDSS